MGKLEHSAVALFVAVLAVWTSQQLNADFFVDAQLADPSYVSDQSADSGDIFVDALLASYR